MPLPLILGAAALIAGGVGIKKGLEAKEDFALAERIGRRAKANHEEAAESLAHEKEQTNQKLMELGQLKVDIFSNQIRVLVDEIKKRKNAFSKLSNFNQVIDELDLPQLEKMVLGSLDIEKGAASGTASGILVGLGAYGGVGLLASASTGTAIASLSGAAATNATLAWLGGGSLAAGGFGMAGGMVVLGGLVAGPAIAITGFVMASKAEEALTRAYEYEAEVDGAIEKINAMGLVLKGLQANAMEMGLVLSKLVTYFDSCKADLSEKNSDEAFKLLVKVGCALKKVLETPIMEANGEDVQNLDEKLKSIVSVASTGLLEYGK